MARDQRLIMSSGPWRSARNKLGDCLGVECQCQVELNIIPIASRPLSPASSVATLIELHETFSRLNSGDTSVGRVGPINKSQQRPKEFRRANVALQTQ
jgi:hypothetical protein